MSESPRNSSPPEGGDEARAEGSEPLEAAPAEPASPEPGEVGEATGEPALSGNALFGSEAAPLAEAPLVADDFASAEPQDVGEAEASPLDQLDERALDGNQPLISPEESDAIIAAMRAGSLRPDAVPPVAASGNVHFKSAHDAQRTQLGAPEAPLRRAIELADRVCGELADAVLDKLLQLATVIANASLIPSEVVSVEAALEPYVATGAGWDVIGVGRSGLRGTIVIAGGLADALLARRLGAGDAVKPGGTSRGLSPLGRRVLHPFAEACLDCVAKSFFGERRELRLVAAGSTPAKLAPFAPCLKFGVRVRFGEIEDDVVVVLYDEALAAAVRTDGPSDREQWGRILEEVDVEIVARLGIAHTSVRAFLGLRTGSVLRLDGSPERPVSLLVDGTPVLLGMPMVHEGNLAIEVKS